MIAIPQLDKVVAFYKPSVPLQCVQ